jgi:hypothetical protein
MKKRKARSRSAASRSAHHRRPRVVATLQLSLWKGCASKSKLSSKKLARSVLRKQFTEDEIALTLLNIYHCRHCRGWHIGRLRRRRGRGVKET